MMLLDINSLHHLTSLENQPQQKPEPSNVSLKAYGHICQRTQPLENKLWKQSKPH